MGRVSKELKDLAKIREQQNSQLSVVEKKLEKHKKKVVRKTPTYPVNNVDYHWVAVRPGYTAPRGWVLNASVMYRSKQDLKHYLNKETYKEREPMAVKKSPYHNKDTVIYFLYHGAPPNPEWGPLCP